MKHFGTSLIFACLTLALTGCATAPDPAKVCTSEWIGERSDKAISRIQSKAGSSLKSLRKAGESWSKGNKPNFIQMALLSRSLKGLENELKNGRGMRDLKTVAATCNDPKIISEPWAALCANKACQIISSISLKAWGSIKSLSSLIRHYSTAPND